MADVILTRDYPAPPVSMKEILRYARAGGAEDGAVAALAEECLRIAEGSLAYRVCWREFEISDAGDGLDLGFARVRSKALRRSLAGCARAVLFAATVGLGIDRLIARYRAVSPARALMLQAVGTERVEALCDAFCSDISRQARAEGRFTRPRFSPGYGDLPLELQREVFRALDCPRKIGLTLNDSLLMSPSKSVTAIVGLGDAPCGAGGGCAACDREDCGFRKDGGNG